MAPATNRWIPANVTKQLPVIPPTKKIFKAQTPSQALKLPLAMDYNRPHRLLNYQLLTPDLPAPIRAILFECEQSVSRLPLKSFQ